MTKVGILDYGMGNIGSIRNMVNYVAKCDVVYIEDEKSITEVDKIILPGVGAFDAGMELLNEKRLIDAIQKFANVEKKPILGICLGMQLLGNRSEEGVRTGLQLIDFDVVRFRQEKLKVPHMGWNYVKVEGKAPLVEGIGDDNRYYFVHSYHAVCKDETNILMTCKYGDNFTAAVCKDNIYGVQFHPEKSHSYGMKILKNFVEVC